ncbi:phosphoribosyltransferase [Lacisediminimonas profundi]|uniref:phosphoribosyltransferase n=1 Tax=Lacisediminimonas profundi TaxID=2603856 RepID=UPI00124B4BCF|nr:phosphoribosyltransferase family protein [Lacisediminimonas profundi]
MKIDHHTRGGNSFADRIDAGEQLADELLEYRGRNPLILAIPRGALPIGKVLADRLDGDLDVVLVHKLSLPFDPEYAIGAIDESGWSTISSGYEDMDKKGGPLEKVKATQLAALHKRRQQYTPLGTAQDPRGRIAIVVDDGLATGATMIAALHAVRARHPAELICAVPVAAPDSLERVGPLADKVVCLRTPYGFSAVSQFYRNFQAVEDDEAAAILKDAVAARQSRPHPEG